jgi:hypothetical protein
VQINTCNASIPSQRWTFTPDETALDNGRFSPSTNTSLCLTGISSTYYRLKLCDLTNTQQLFSGWRATPKFELYPYEQTDRCVTQEHDPKVFEQIIDVNCEKARADKTNYWGILNPIGYYEPNGIEQAHRDDLCVLDLDLVNHLAIRTGDPFTSPDHRNVVLEQLYNGNLVIRDQDNIVWQSGINEPLGNYYTTIQGDGNMLTIRGEVRDERDSDDIVWRSNSALSSGRRSDYFLGLACNGSYVGLFKGSTNDIQEMYWHEDATWPLGSVLSDAGPLNYTTAPSQDPPSSPSEILSTLPTSAPTLRPTPAPWTTIPTSSPTAAPWAESSTSIPSAAPWTESTTSIPTAASWTAIPTSISTAAPWTAKPTSILSPAPVSSPKPTDWISSSYQTTETQQGTPGNSCSSNPDCSHLSGDCCPTSDGKFLACCDHYDFNECKPYSLSLRQRDLPSIKEGEVFHSPEDDTVQLEQWDNGNLVIRDGASIIWESNQQNVTGQWYTKLQENGNLVTYPGVKDVWRGTPIWESGVPESASWSKSPMFLGLDCTRRYLGVYKGTSDNPGERIWKIATYNVIA